MTENKKPVSVPEISGCLADHMSSLAAMTEKVGDTASTYILKHLEPRLRQGLVRIAVIGVTGSGKSTAINALVEQLVLPENPSVSTPIPVWLGYGDEKKPSAEIYCSEDGKVERKVCDIPIFRRKYCYNINDILDRDRTRYNNVEFGAIQLDAPVLRDNVTIIDTLGISATSIDSRKTIRVLEEGVDAVVFVTKEKLTIVQMRFLYQHVLCCRSRTNPDETEIRSGGILPKNIFFVYNNFYGVPNKVEFSERLRVFYQESGLDLQQKDIEEYIEKNVFYINAYRARLGKMGPYPYVGSAPEGTTEETLEALAELESGEQEECDLCDASQLVQESGITVLSDAIGDLCRRLCYGENAVATNRIRELITIVDGIIQSANTQMALKHLDTVKLQQKRQDFAVLEMDDKKEQEQIAKAMAAFAKDYHDGFEKLIKAILPELKTACGGFAERKIMPREFKKQYKAFEKMSKKERQEYLSAMLPGEIKSNYEYCTEYIIKALDERQSNTFQTPFAVMEAVRAYIQLQEILFESRIRSLRDAGGEELGMFFPESMVVKELFAKLELDLDEKVKEIIADACISNGKIFEEERMAKYMKHCSLNIFNKIVGLFDPEKEAAELWKKIKNKVFVPMAEYIVEEMPKQTFEQISEKTAAAFHATCSEICRSHMKLFVSLEITLNRLDAQITDEKKKTDAAEVDMDKLKAVCEEIRADILQMQHALQHSEYIQKEAVQI